VVGDVAGEHGGSFPLAHCGSDPVRDEAVGGLDRLIRVGHTSIIGAAACLTARLLLC
jgi:hypothetical protein